MPALKPREITTNRAIASDLAKVFDVLELFAPSLFQAKQQFWLTGLGLDDPVPTIIKKEWNWWAKELPELATFPISRRYYNVRKSVFQENSTDLLMPAGSAMFVLFTLEWCTLMEPFQQH